MDSEFERGDAVPSGFVISNHADFGDCDDDSGGNRHGHDHVHDHVEEYLYWCSKGFSVKHFISENKPPIIGRNNDSIREIDSPYIPPIDPKHVKHAKPVIPKQIPCKPIDPEE